MLQKRQKVLAKAPSTRDPKRTFDELRQKPNGPVARDGQQSVYNAFLLD
jgi:hypothetical protein